MSVASLPQTFTSALSPPAPAPTRKTVTIIEDKVSIPAWVDDRESFRRWARSDEFPEQGWISFLQGELWVDMTMEEMVTHNQVKVAFTVALGWFVQNANSGRFIADGMLLTNENSDLSTEPDGLFFTWETVQSGRLQLVEGQQGGIVELSGTPDMVLEIVSKTSVRKDTIRLRELYWKAGIPEYWLVDARGDTLRFEILRHAAEGYEATPAKDGWIASAAFGKSFRLTKAMDPLGQPRYTLEMKAA